MVTRTVTATKVNVLCLNVETVEPFNKSIVLPRTYAPEKLFKAVQSVVDTITEKAVQVVDVEEVETLYGMDEQYFIEHAKVLDKETRKPIE